MRKYWWVVVVANRVIGLCTRLCISKHHAKDSPVVVWRSVDIRRLCRELFTAAKCLFCPRRGETIWFGILIVKRMLVSSDWVHDN